MPCTMLPEGILRTTPQLSIRRPFGSSAIPEMLGQVGTKTWLVTPQFGPVDMVQLPTTLVGSITSTSD